MSPPTLARRIRPHSNVASPASSRNGSVVFFAGARADCDVRAVRPGRRVREACRPWAPCGTPTRPPRASSSIPSTPTRDRRSADAAMTAPPPMSFGRTGHGEQSYARRWPARGARDDRHRRGQRHRPVPSRSPSRARGRMSSSPISPRAPTLRETQQPRGGRGSAGASRRRRPAGTRRIVDGWSDQTVEALGRIDVLVNNAATQRPRERIEDIPVEEWEANAAQTNITDAVPFSARAAVPHMRPGASIINVTSIRRATSLGGAARLRDDQGRARDLHEGPRRDARPPRHPGECRGAGAGVDATRGIDVRPDRSRQFGANSPFRRPAQPAELAGAFVFLASPAASYVTGATVPVTGGQPFG